MRPLMGTELGCELYRYMVNHLHDTPSEERGHWVMNHEWFTECARLAGWPSGVANATMLGYPFTVTADGGVPHLVAG